MFTPSMETLDVPEFPHMNVILQQTLRQILKRENPKGLSSVSLELIDQINGSTTHEEGAHWENEAGSVALIKVPPRKDRCEVRKPRFPSRFFPDMSY